jgi:hypothetical protein
MVADGVFLARRINFDSNETQLVTKHDDAVRCVEFSEELSALLPSLITESLY